MKRNTISGRKTMPDKDIDKISLIDFLKRYSELSIGNKKSIHSLSVHLGNYKKGTIALKDVNGEWFDGFVSFLSETTFTERFKMKGHLSYKTKVIYLSKLCKALNYAFDEKLISFKPPVIRHIFKPQVKKIEVLTPTELISLKNAYCAYPVIKNCFLFICLTGIRKEDLNRLTWADLYKQGNRTYFQIKKRYNSEVYNHFVPTSALRLLKRNSFARDTDLVFDGMPVVSAQHSTLQKWAIEAGIGKKISFIVARSTFMSLSLQLGIDKITLSNMTGYKDFKTFNSNFQSILSCFDQEKTDNTMQLIDGEL